MDKGSNASGESHDSEDHVAGYTVDKVTKTRSLTFTLVLILDLTRILSLILPLNRSPFTLHP
jgi:hypothetical protein